MIRSPADIDRKSLKRLLEDPSWCQADKIHRYRKPRGSSTDQDIDAKSSCMGSDDGNVRVSRDQWCIVSFYCITVNRERRRNAFLLAPGVDLSPHMLR